MNDAFAALDRMGEDSPQDQKPDGEPAETQDEEAGNEAEADAKPDTKPEEKPNKPDEKKKGAATLRKAYDDTKAELAKAQSRLKELESGSAGDAAKKLETVGKELTAARENLAAREKRLQELEGELRYSRYEASEEYKSKWLQPYLDAYKEGQDFSAGLKVTQADGTERAATGEDFDAVIAMYARSPGEGARMLNELFGESAPSVLYHVKEALKLNGARLKAVDEAKKTGRGAGEADDRAAGAAGGAGPGAMGRGEQGGAGEVSAMVCRERRRSGGQPAAGAGV